MLSLEDAELLGYFSITIKPLVVRAEPFSNTVKRKLITGKELLEAAMRQIQALQYQAGGMVAFVEAENKVKLLSFYESYGFKQFDTRQTVSKESEPYELVQLLRLV